MKKSSYDRMRAKPRFNVSLKAACRIKEQGEIHQQCRITNLSMSGATVQFLRNENISVSNALLLDIPIPDTIMHVSAEAEIIWIKQRFNGVVCGVKFRNILSDSLIQQLIKKTWRPALLE